MKCRTSFKSVADSVASPAIRHDGSGYQDLRDGIVLTDARFTRADPNGHWLFHATADNVGYRDQRYSAMYQRTGRFELSGLWDEIPQFYSVDTRTPYMGSGGNLVLDDAIQRAIQQGNPAKLNLYLPAASQFIFANAATLARST